MSAWIVSAHHIDALAYAAVKRNILYCFRKLSERCESPAKVGRILLAQCVRSVRLRYPDLPDHDLPGSDARPENYTYRTPARFTPVALVKAVDCLDYQSCEDPAWAESEAYAICEALRIHLIGELPGYESARTWGIEEDMRVPRGIQNARSVSKHSYSK